MEMQRYYYAYFLTLKVFGWKNIRPKKQRYYQANGKKKKGYR